jgi:hypothetical protein
MPAPAAEEISSGRLSKMFGAGSFSTMTPARAVVAPLQASAATTKPASVALLAIVPIARMSHFPILPQIFLVPCKFHANRVNSWKINGLRKYPQVEWLHL